MASRTGSFLQGSSSLSLWEAVKEQQNNRVSMEEAWVCKLTLAHLFVVHSLFCAPAGRRALRSKQFRESIRTGLWGRGDRACGSPQRGPGFSLGSGLERVAGVGTDVNGGQTGRGPEDAGRSHQSFLQPREDVASFSWRGQAGPACPEVWRVITEPSGCALTRPAGRRAEEDVISLEGKDAPAPQRLQGRRLARLEADPVAPGP